MNEKNFYINDMGYYKIKLLFIHKNARNAANTVSDGVDAPLPTASRCAKEKTRMMGKSLGKGLARPMNAGLFGRLCCNPQPEW